MWALRCYFQHALATFTYFATSIGYVRRGHTVIYKVLLAMLISKLCLQSGLLLRSMLSWVLIRSDRRERPTLLHSAPGTVGSLSSDIDHFR